MIYHCPQVIEKYQLWQEVQRSYSVVQGKRLPRRLRVALHVMHFHHHIVQPGRIVGRLPRQHIEWPTQPDWLEVSVELAVDKQLRGRNLVRAKH